MVQGRPPKGVDQHLAQGTFRRGRHAAATLPVEVPPMPPDLSPAAQACWNVVAEDLRFSGIVSRVDGKALRLLAESWALYLEAEDAIRKHGAVVEGRGMLRPNPAIAVRATVTKEIMAILRQFGLTPQARGAVRVGAGSSEGGDKSKVADILKLRPA